MTYPNSHNFCGGNFQDWLEVNLTDKCNGKCPWCIEKYGYHPKHHASWKVIAKQAIKSGKTNIILLGGEPLLYKDLSKVVAELRNAFRKVWITTNGGLLTQKYVKANLYGVTGVNISIHTYDLLLNKSIVGVDIKYLQLKDAIFYLHILGANVRLNCNCIKGHIDSVLQIENYIKFAKGINADKIRFAELKQDNENFVDLAKVLNYKYGLNDNPFTKGCNSDAVIDGMPVNFRQMCGLQTSRRDSPEDPVQHAKSVLYYDGKFYDGWQTKEGGMGKKNDSYLAAVLKLV
ncbi:MAG: radical SAM protein, partial [Alphaproteobacteria bacterium]